MTKETNKPRPVVYIVQEGNHDYTPAMEYGDLEILSEHEITPMPLNVSATNRNTVVGIRNKLSGYVPGHDYLLLVGSPIAIAWAVAIVAPKGSIHKMLKWDNQDRRYKPYEVGPGVLRGSAP